MVVRAERPAGSVAVAVSIAIPAPTAAITAVLSVVETVSTPGSDVVAAKLSESTSGLLNTDARFTVIVSPTSALYGGNVPAVVTGGRLG